MKWYKSLAVFLVIIWPRRALGVIDDLNQNLLPRLVWAFSLRHQEPTFQRGTEIPPGVWIWWIRIGGVLSKKYTTLHDIEDNATKVGPTKVSFIISFKLRLHMWLSWRWLYIVFTS